MGRGNSNGNLLYGGGIDNLRSSLPEDQPKSKPMSKSKSQSTQKNDKDLPDEAYFHSNSNKSLEIWHGPHKTAPNYKTIEYDLNGLIKKKNIETPLIGFDYKNNLWYDEQPGHDYGDAPFETNQEKWTVLLEKPDLDPKQFAIPEAEWNFPTEEIFEDGVPIIKRYQLKNYLDQTFTCREPELGPAEIEYYDSELIKTERYFTAAYSRGDAQSTLNNPYGPAAIGYYPKRDVSGEQIVEYKIYTRLKEAQGVLEDGYTEYGRCDRGPGLEVFDEQGNLIEEQYFSDNNKLKKIVHHKTDQNSKSEGHSEKKKPNRFSRLFKF